MHPIERELAKIPERALQIYRGTSFTDALKLLAGEKDLADPEWLEARVENMLLTNGLALSRMRALQREAEGLLQRYSQLPKADPGRLSGFELTGRMTLEKQIAQLEENSERFRQLLQAVRDTRKQRSMISLAQLLQRFSP